MKKILAIAILLLIVSVGYCQNQPLQLTIKSDKGAYGVGEDIFIDYMITNTGENDITIAPPFGEDGTIASLYGGNFIIKGESQENLEKISPYADIDTFGVSPVTIKKGESYSKKVNIVRRRGGLRYSSTDYLQRADKYTIIGQYEWGEIRGNYPTPNCWKGLLASNTITVEVAEKSDGVHYPLLGMASKAKVIAEDFLAGQNFKNVYEEKAYSIKEENNFVDCFFKRKISLKVKGDGLVRVNKKTWKAEWVPSL